MKAAVLLLSLLSFLAIQCLAQQASRSSFAPPAPNQNSASATQSSPAHNNNDLRGCLSGSKGNYSLLDHQGKSHKVTGDSHVLWDDVGHEVDLTGKMGAHGDFQETSATDIASRCWNFKLN